MLLGLRKLVRDNGLFLAMTLAFLACLGGMMLAGWQTENETRATLHEPLLKLGEYLATGHFRSALFENWESEFLQMAMYVVLTVWLVQRGSSESKVPDQPAPQDEDPRTVQIGPKTPWPVRRGGLWLVLYENSLLLLFTVLFVLAFCSHAEAGLEHFNREQARLGLPATDLAGFLSDGEFWFESLQNWQSEFLVMAILVIATVYLRQRGSPESKPVAAPHRETGS